MKNKEAIEILSHNSNLGYGIVIEGDNTKDIQEALKVAIGSIKAQAELLDYIKLSLEKSDEFKEKYRNKHKESNSQHDLYYSHLFEGMAEAYDDLLKKKGESDTQGKPKQGTIDGKSEMLC